MAQNTEAISVDFSAFDLEKWAQGVAEGSVLPTEEFWTRLEEETNKQQQ